MNIENNKSSRYTKANNTPPQVLRDMQGNREVFEQMAAGAEKLSELARRADEESVRVSQAALSRAEEVSKQAKEAAESAAEVSQQAINRAEEVTKSTEGRYSFEENLVG